MANGDMLNFLPLNETAIERMPEVQDWIREWTGLNYLEALTPTEWFDRGHGLGGGKRKTDGMWEAQETGEKWLL